MTEERLQKLLEDYAMNRISPEDLAELERFAAGNQSLLKFMTELRSAEGMAGLIMEYAHYEHGMESQLAKNTQELKLTEKVKSMKHGWRYIAAASVLLTVGMFAFYYSHIKRTESGHADLQIASHKPTLPGINQAVLSVGAEKNVLLSSAGNNKALALAGITGARADSTVLVYTGEQTETPVTHSLSTPRAGQFSVILSDGTRVWLNNSSRLSYPDHFRGNARVVELAGEGYFEVGKDAARPFIVRVKGVDVRVLGTSFNVKGYNDEKELTATLVEGKVSIEARGKTQVLEAGNQLVIGSAGWLYRQKADISQAIAWKNGLFNFDHVGIKEVMLQLSRWYNVQVMYEGVVKDEVYYGSIQRSLPLENILKSLAMEAELNFNLQGDTIIVSKK